MAKPRNKTVDYLVYLLCRVVATFIGLTGVQGVYAAARAGGSLFFLLDRRHRRLAIDHIAAGMPELDEVQARRIAKQSMQAVILLGAEVLLTPRMVTIQRWADHFRLVNIDRILRPLVDGREGIILLTGHYGNWEVAGYLLATLGFPAVAVARPLDNPYLDRLVRGVRERQGLKILDKKGAAAVSSDVLDRHGTLCFIADQDAGRKGLFVDFFGRPASTYRAIALLAIHHNVPIAVSYAKRLNDGFCFEVGISRVLAPEEWAQVDDPVHWITQTYTHELESIIRADPGQYFGWTHRRWKHRPETGVVAGYRTA